MCRYKSVAEIFIYNDYFNCDDRPTNTRDYDICANAIGRFAVGALIVIFTAEIVGMARCYLFACSIDFYQNYLLLWVKCNL